MSKINDLIKKLCPNGVKFYKLSDIGEQFNGLSGKSKKDFENGNCKYITYTNIYNNPSINLEVEDYVKVDTNEKQNEIRFKDILIAGSSENLEDSGMISVVTKEPKDKIYLNSFCFGLRLKADFYEKFNPDFLKHIFRDKNFRNEIISCSFGVTRYNLSKEKFLKIKVPCPPLEVQEEIVRILDKFGELEAELEAELEVRKSQYEFWRRKLMKLENIECESIPLSKVYEFKYGTGNTIPDIGGDYPVYGSNGIVGTHNEWNSEDAPVIGHIGAYAGIINWAPGKHFVTYNGVICKKINDNVDARYAYYLLRNENFLGEQKGAQPFVSYDALKKPIVKIPDFSIQRKIAVILDKFDALVNDITEGIPAEIELRRQQYEYYRNRLLSFEELINE